MAPVVVGIIGGSALGDAFGLEDEQAKFLVTPHGAPRDPPRMGKHGDVTVVVRPRLETRAEAAHVTTSGDVVGMTTASEASLASEAWIPCGALCTVDNVASGIAAEPPTFDRSRETLRKTASLAGPIVAKAVERL